MVYEVSCDEEECVFEDGGLCIKSRLTMSRGACASKVFTIKCNGATQINEVKRCNADSVDDQ